MTATGNDPNETAEILNRDLLKISNWANVWKVKFNASKTKDIRFSNMVLNNSPHLVFNDDFITRVNTHRHLGVFLTSNLNWSVQINDVCFRANRKLSVLRHVKMLKRNTLDLLYKLTVRSVIDYFTINCIFNCHITNSCLSSHPSRGYHQTPHTAHTPHNFGLLAWNVIYLLVKFGCQKIDEQAGAELGQAGIELYFNFL